MGRVSSTVGDEYGHECPFSLPPPPLSLSLSPSHFPVPTAGQTEQMRRGRDRGGACDHTHQPKPSQIRSVRLCDSHPSHPSHPSKSPSPSLHFDRTLLPLRIPTPLARYSSTYILPSHLQLTLPPTLLPSYPPTLFARNLACRRNRQ